MPNTVGKAVPAAAPDARPRSRADIRRWRQYLADERAEAAVYRDLAARREGGEREILLALAEAEGRHEQHWLDLLGDDVGEPRRGDLRTRILGFFARRFGSVWVLALAQRAEARSPYDTDVVATDAMAADERIHGEVVRGLAIRGRLRISGTFRAAVFGANDGLVSNLALVLGIGATGVSTATVLFTGLAGLLAGALSMGAGEYVSVRSQRELIDAAKPDPQSHTALPDLDVDANELALVYRARGMSEAHAQARAAEVLGSLHLESDSDVDDSDDESDTVGTAWGAAFASFCFFASGALIPVVPYLCGASGFTAVVIASALVGLALLGTGAVVGLLSGASPLKRAVRQLAIGFGAAGVTYLLGLAFGTTIG
ncbi:MAG: VIT1/CCC1 transporter family protein [Microbacteriaceae bacterium]|nr:VIT1/CCC1 transporter family protein [Microbacteriaceae bacterium]